MKKRVLAISGAISFGVFLILLLIIRHIGGSLDDQQMAERWSKDGGVAQVSCFFSVDSQVSEEEIETFEHSVDSKLAEASVVQESENPGARLWVDAYSADGSVMISNDRSTVSTKAIGIGGDFFLFHPVKLVSGGYFSGNDLMQDYCVIDRDVAWQLFGSDNVAGMTVYIGNVPHIVTGVIERPEGRFAEAAGLDGTLIFVSYKTLSELGQNNGLNHYEIVMPDPVSGFAESVVRDNFGSDPNTTEILENTTRFSLLSRLKLLGQFGLRSMNGKAIIYPYWENIARGYGDVLTLLTFLELLFLAFALAVALGLFISWWRHKGWTVKEKLRKLKDRLERLGEKRYAKRWESRAKRKLTKAERTAYGSEKKDRTENRKAREKKGKKGSRKREDQRKERGQEEL